MHRNRKVPLTEKNEQQQNPDYFLTPRTASFAALATRNLTTVLAGILIFCCVLGLKPLRAVLFNLFVCERAERLEEYSSGCFVGLGGSRECDLKFCLGHLYGLWQCYYTISRESLTVSFPGSQSLHREQRMAERALDEGTRSRDRMG